jgi:hypothetical protein
MASIISLVQNMTDNMTGILKKNGIKKYIWTRKVLG